MQTENITSRIKSEPSGVSLKFTIGECHYEMDITLAVDQRRGVIDWLIVRNLLIQKGFNPEMATRLMVSFERHQDIRDNTAMKEYHHPFAKFLGNTTPNRRSYSKHP